MFFIVVEISCSIFFCWYNGWGIMLCLCYRQIIISLREKEVDSEDAYTDIQEFTKNYNQLS